MFCGSWNVNAKKLEGELQDWLLPDPRNRADIYAIGFQEIVDLNAMNVALDGTKTQQRSQYWQEIILDCIQNNEHQYKLVESKHLVGILLCVYVKDVHASRVKDIRSTITGVGLMGMMGNKGAVTIRLNLYDSSLCFVCCHLAAHRENVTGRNSDAKNIIERSNFLASDSILSLSVADQNIHKKTDIYHEKVNDLVVRPRHGTEKTQGTELTVLDHEFVFWLGDLNYRIDEEVSTDSVFQYCDSCDWAALRVKDQLNIERAKQNVLIDFEEGILNFAPTYKYQPGTDHYDKRPEKKIRAPAWCDRILWRCTKKVEDIKQLYYSSYPKLLSSDHKPVGSLFNCNLQIVIAEKLHNVYQELMLKLEYWHNANLPQVEVTGFSSGWLMDMDMVRFGMPTSHSLNIKNTGASIVHWHFLPKIGELDVCKRWITIECQRGLLLPGESIDVVFTVLVDTKTAQSLNRGRDSLDDIIVLHIENSTDFYIAITAEYQRSCYGISLEDLVTMQEPVRYTRLPALLKDASSSHDVIEQQMPSSVTKLSVPKELWRLVDVLSIDGALKEKDLFNGEALDTEVHQVIESLDCGTEFPPSLSPHSIAKALVWFISSLPKPLLDVTIPAMDTQNLRQWSRKILDSLTSLNYNVFIYLMSFMREIYNQRDYNRCSAERLSLLCTNMMYFSPTDNGISFEERNRRESKMQIIRYFISYLLETASL